MAIEAALVFGALLALGGWMLMLRAMTGVLYLGAGGLGALGMTLIGSLALLAISYWFARGVYRVVLRLMTHWLDVQ